VSEAAEIRALASLVDELDYYQILEVTPSCASSDLKRAYHSLSRRFHPDANRHRDQETREAIDAVAKRLTEAYSVLRDPRRRQAYDQRIESGDGVRMQLAEAEAHADKKQQRERLGSTPNGRRYYAMAEADRRAGNLDGAIRNLQTAVMFEPANPNFKELLDALRKERR